MFNFFRNIFCKNKNDDVYINALKRRIEILEKMLLKRENNLNKIIHDWQKLK